MRVVHTVHGLGVRVANFNKDVDVIVLEEGQKHLKFQQNVILQDLNVCFWLLKQLKLIEEELTDPLTGFVLKSIEFRLYKS